MEATLIQFEKTTVRPFGDDRHIIKTEYRERCFIYQSFGSHQTDFGDMMIRAHVSFLADSGKGMAAEWEPQHGPIQIWTECPEDWKGESAFGGSIEARKHWHFPFVENDSLAWSQLAVEREGLKEMLVDGDLGGVFDVLEQWADR